MRADDNGPVDCRKIAIMVRPPYTPRCHRLNQVCRCSRQAGHVLARGSQRIASMKTLRLLAALVPLLLASTAHAAVERRTAYRGETADAFFATTGSDGCFVTNLNVLTNELEEKLAVDGSMQKLQDIFGVVTLTMFDRCNEMAPLAFSGYADTTLEQNSFSLSIDPQHDRARFQAHLIMQDDSFTFYWITIDVSWT